jgi:hypothetical protein
MVKKWGMEPMSSEHPARTAPKTPILQNPRETGTESGTLRNESAATDPDLAMIVRHWPGLPVEVRNDILRIVREHTPQPQDRRVSP